eukprot:TRINITY_DN1182_c0_g3_i2.p1 TRINITY_DN1182_c0_g3~~TRINITY_DN1182_c0_g3_i2.p1  ORF type:complete len:287 (+),score=43.23 TRINITY_DN1182_c0_g3_i2:45-905(+)
MTSVSEKKLPFAAINYVSANAVPLTVKVAAYPLERMRMLMQVQATNTTFEKSSFKSIFHTLRHFKSENNWLSPWRGAPTTIVRWLPTQYIILSLHHHMKGCIPESTGKGGYGARFLSGAVTALAASLIWSYPLDVIRQQVATREAGTWRHSAYRVYELHGIRGYYRGFLINTPGLMTFRAIQLGGWDLVKEHYGKEAWDKKSRPVKIFHGQLISLLGSLLGYPYDTIRRNVISYDGNGSTIELVKRGILRSGGIRSFLYAGYSARVLSSVVNGGLLEGFDEWNRAS